MGGTTFQRDRSGTVIRTRPIPILRRTEYTNHERSTWQLLTRTWRTLSQGDRDDWQTQADAITWTNKFGEVIPGLGYWLFLQTNGYRLLLGAGINTTAGTVAAIGAITGLTAVYNVAGGTLDVSWGSGNVPADDRWFVFATPPLSGGRSGGFSRYRYIADISPTSASPIDLFASYQLRFPVQPGASDSIYLEVRPVLQSWNFPGTPVRIKVSII